MGRLATVAYFAALTLLLLVGGGLLTSRMLDVPGPGQDDRPTWTVTWVVIGGLTLTVLAIGIRRWQNHPRRFWFGNILFVCWLPFALGVVEAFCRLATPAWPAQALHGVDPALSRKAWGSGLKDGNTAFNSWGQRDRERLVRPSAGTYRIAFIGDSFLEESSQAVSLSAEKALGRDDCEILNLGVSSTQPDEYYDRLRSVALPLGCRHCVVWIFSGNDFVDEPRTLSSRWGLCAVAPRMALLTNIGCRSLNHLLTNNDRPVIQAWFAAGGLAAREARLYDQIRRASDAELRNALSSGAHSTVSHANLKSRLDALEITPFFEILRTPDEGKFRSYYLTSGLLSAASGGSQWDPNPETQTLYWVTEMQRTCVRRGVKLTVVVIPEAFQVDSRMRQQWLPLADMRHVTQPCRTAADCFCKIARQQELDVLDLHPVFQDVPGTYLNLDGHWSQAGVDLAAQAIVDHLRRQLPTR